MSGKRKYVRRVATLLIAAMAVGFFGSRQTADRVQATTTQQQLDQAQKDKNEIAGQLDETNAEIGSLKGEQKTLKGELQNLNTQLTEVCEHLEELEGQIAVKTQEIEDAQAAIAAAIETEERQYADMVRRVRNSYENLDEGYMTAYLEAGNFSEILNARDYFQEIMSYDRSTLADYKENRRLIEEAEAALQEDRIQLENLKVAAEAEKSRVSGLISQTSHSISVYADQIAATEEEARAYEAQLKEKEKDIEYLKKKLAEEQALAKRAKDGKWRSLEEVTFDPNDRYLLANLIYCEAGAEPYDGKVAVGSVVINRVLSGVFPDTVVGVIYQKKQFSPVASGRLELALTNNKATADCYRAADEAMSGVTNVENCVFFRTPIEGLVGRYRIGGHVFY